MVLPIFPMIWVNHRKKHQWYSHIIWKLLVLSTSRLACNSFMACILHMYPYDWASMRKPWHVLNNVCNKMQQVLVAFSKSSSSTFLATAVTCDTQYHRDSAKTARPTLQRCLQESPPWKYEHGLNTAFFTEWCGSGRVIGFQYFQWFLCLATSGHYKLHCSASAKPDETFEVSRARFEESWKLILPSGNLTHEAMENSRLSFLNIYIYFVGNTEFTLQLAMLVDCSVLQYLNRFFTTCPVSFRCQLHAEWH